MQAKMLISELIAKLNYIKDQVGDLPVNYEDEYDQYNPLIDAKFTIEVDGPLVFIY